jgi:hypothetical protein
MILIDTFILEVGQFAPWTIRDGLFVTDYSLQDNSLRGQFATRTIGDMYSSLRTIRYQGLLATKDYSLPRTIRYGQFATDNSLPRTIQ